MGIACTFCIASRGIKGTGNTLDGKTRAVFDTEEEYFDHLEMEHDLVVRREGETEEEARKRVEDKQRKAFGFVRLGSEKCNCPACRGRRGDVRDLIANLVRAGVKTEWNITETDVKNVGR